jgi:hypothetical protein
MNTELIRARLNLYAVLQNLEELVRLDAEMAALVKSWDVSIQFAVRGGPVAHLVFKGGACRHGRGPLPGASVKLFFTSPEHLNRMFDGKSNPIPLKGFTRLGFLTKEFPKLTDRLTVYLKPEEGRLADPDFLRINTALTLFTATYAVKELSELDPVSMKVAGHMPKGVLQIGVLPDGPWTYIDFSGNEIVAGKAKVERPAATMTFQDMGVANALLAGKLDAFLAVAEGKVVLLGQLPIIDNVGLILDRVPIYLK